MGILHSDRGVGFRPDSAPGVAGAISSRGTGKKISTEISSYIFIFYPKVYHRVKCKVWRTSHLERLSSHEIMWFRSAVAPSSRRRKHRGTTAGRHHRSMSDTVRHAQHAREAVHVSTRGFSTGLPGETEKFWALARPSVTHYTGVSHLPLLVRT